uniref:Uncharacterized protein n=1 Tax=Balaenoptera musculus TaxID=9771 RepID=A0A8C0DVP5_BALMU
FDTLTYCIMITPIDPMAMDWWRDNFWIILAVAIIFVSVGLSIFLFCVCRHLFRQGKKWEITKPLKQKQRDEETMYELSPRSWSRASPFFKTYAQGIPWRSSGWDSALSLPRAWIQSLVRELRSCKPHGVAKKIFK